MSEQVWILIVDQLCECAELSERRSVLWSVCGWVWVWCAHVFVTRFRTVCVWGCLLPSQNETLNCCVYTIRRYQFPAGISLQHRLPLVYLVYPHPSHFSFTCVDWRWRLLFTSLYSGVHLYTVRMYFCSADLYSFAVWRSYTVVQTNSHW